MDYELIHQSINRARALANRLGLDLDDVLRLREEELKKAKGRGRAN